MINQTLRQVWGARRVSQTRSCCRGGSALSCDEHVYWAGLEEADELVVALFDLNNNYAQLLSMYIIKTGHSKKKVQDSLFIHNL